MDTLVVIPTYNEASNVAELTSQLMALGIPDLHLLFVDDNSPDGTANVAESLNADYDGRIHVLRRASKEGLGPAYIAGLKEALRLGASNVIQMDADLSHPPEYVPMLLESLKSCDIAVGSRYVTGGGTAEDWGLSRRLLSRSGDIYVHMALGLPIQDSKSGFKAFRREVLEHLDFATIRSKGFIFQAEVLYRCHKMGYRIKEVPFTFHDRKAGRSKMSFAIIAEALWRTLLVRWGRSR